MVCTFWLLLLLCNGNWLLLYDVFGHSVCYLWSKNSFDDMDPWVVNKVKTNHFSKYFRWEHQIRKNKILFLTTNKWIMPTDFLFMDYLTVLISSFNPTKNSYLSEYAFASRECPVNLLAISSGNTLPDLAYSPFLFKCQVCTVIIHHGNMNFAYFITQK